MFLHAGAVLDSGWIEETTQFIQGVSSSGRPRAGIFRYARSPYADTGLRDGFKYLARMFIGPSAEQGLLIAREHYDRLGGVGVGPRPPAAPRPGCCGSSAARRAPCCAAGSWWLTSHTYLPKSNNYLTMAS